jgi:hypothetical protein
VTPDPEIYEKLGLFYLGRHVDPAHPREPADDAPPLLYDSRDLTTHALCVGMTGSGKTGLCVSLLEEAAIDGVPALVIDPKGDLGNLLLTFPSLAPEEFEPWVDPDAARRKGQSVAEYAAGQAQLWREGLASWGQGPERLERLRASAEFTLYTPGSRAGRPVSVLASLEAPPAAVRADPDLLGDRIEGVVAGLLSLLGVAGDPLTSREHVLLAAILEDRWKQGLGLDLPGLVASVQQPPVTRVGVMEVESFYPAGERFELALKLNHLLAAPGFEAWLEGEPLDVGRLLYTAEGKPRVAIFSISHLSDDERMFFVSLLLTQVVSWMRGLPGTGSLRALLYMDEVMGYLPPVAEPPSKRAILTLLKQARAFGVGLVLATQNPVDVDYKALSNMGTWFLGRLQTERDRQRVMDGLLQAAPGGLDRGRIEAILSDLPKRTFFLHNVHEEEPAVFRTRWAMSYLKGPLTRPEIARLTPGAGPAGASAPPPVPAAPSAPSPPPSPASSPAAGAATAPPVLPSDVPQAYAEAPAGAVLVPWLVGEGEVSYVDDRRGVDTGEEVVLAYPLEALPDDAGSLDWSDARRLDAVPETRAAPPAGVSFAELPPAAARGTSYTAWRKGLADHLYREYRLELLESPTFGLTSRPGEDERAFRLRLADAARERRDEAVRALRERYEAKVDRLEERQRKAEQRIEREADQARQKKVDTLISAGSSVLSMLFGRSGRRSAGTAIRGVSRSVKESRDIERARDDLAALEDRERELERELEDEVRDLETRLDAAREPLERRRVEPRRADVEVSGVRLVWRDA